MTSRTHFVTRFALTAALVVLSVLGTGAKAWAQSNPAAQALPYSQDFSGVLWTDTVYPSGSQGWTAATGIAGLFPTAAPTGNAALLASSSASTATGGVHNYNGKLGLLGSGSASPALMFALNTTGSAGVAVNYDVMTIRNPQTGLNGLEEVALQYRVGTLGSFVTLKTSTYQNLTGIPNNKTTAGDVTAQNLQARSVTLPPVCDNQPAVQIRWVVRDVSGTFTPGRPAFAIDNLSVTGGSYSTPAAPSDLVARWRMEEGSGTSILDASTNGLNGSTFNAPIWVAGVEGVRSLNFNGTTQYANVADNALLDLTGTMTLAGWIRPAKQGTQSIFAKSTNGATNGYEVTLQTGTAAAPGKPFVRFNQAASADTYRLNAATYYPSDGNTWMHLAATYDGSTARIYVNGALDTSVAMSVAVATNALPLGIASQHDGSGARYFQGLLDDMRVYNRALSASEISALVGLSTHTITASAGANGSIAPSGAVTVNDGANQAFVITPAGGHSVADVLVDGGSVGAVTNYAFNSVTADHTIAASFVANTYTLTYAAGPNGSISGASPQVVSHGASGSAVTAVPDANYHFVSWSDGGLTATRTDSNVMANLSVTASFAINQYTLTYTAGANGAISGTSPQIVNHGASGSAVTAVPDPGYDFDDWSDGVLTATRTDTNVQADASVTANFVLSAPANTSTVNVGPAGGLITQANPVRTVPVTISRTDLTPMLGFSVTFSVSSALNVNGGPGGIDEGAYLATANPNTVFNVIDQGVDGFGNHNYQVDGATLGSPCGSSAASGTLFTIDLASAAAGGSGTVTITDLTLRDCLNADLPSVIGTSSTLTIDQSAPSVLVVAPNGGELLRVGSLQVVDWTASDAEGLTTIDLAYSTDGGATYPHAIATVPGTETSYPWTIPATPSSLVRLRVTAHDANGNTAADASDANFTIAYYTLAYTAGAGGSIVGANPQSVAHGADGSLVTATPDPGYSFVAWSDGYPTAARTDLDVMADLNVSASFMVNSHTLTYAAGAGGSIVGPNPQVVNHGDDGTLVTATPDPGYHFVAWSDGYPTAARTDLDVTADISVSASFAINTYTLAYSAGSNGSIVGPNPQVVNHGDDGALVTATPDPGYHFVAWSDGYPTAARTDLDVTANISASASFAINTYTLAYSAGAGGSIVGPNPQVVNHGDDGALVTATPDPGYHFVAWSDGYPTAARTDLDVMANVSASASFAINTYTLAYSAGSNGSIVGPTPQVVNHGDDGALVTATPGPGYHFVAWSDGYPTAARTDLDVTANISASASFAINTYTLAYSAGAGGSIVGPNPQVVNHGDDGALVTATPDPGYHFVAWSDGYPTAARTDLDVMANVSASASFAINTYTLAYSAGSNGSIVGPNPQVVNHGDDGALVTATPDPGYHFVAWSDGYPTAARTDLDVTANISASASFALNTYTLAYSAGAGGSIVGPNPQVVNHGDDGALVTATPDPGNHFVAWSDGYPTAARTDLNVTSNISASASFAPNPSVPAIANLSVTRNLTGNPAGATIGLTLSWTATANTVEVWRKGYGFYPEYSDAGGATPSASPTYPPGPGWVLTAVSAPGGIDYVTARDYYYYVAYQQDSYGTWSPAATTGGTLNYFLGDVSDGFTLGTGDNRVYSEDISGLGIHYGISGGAVAGFAYLDVGPTSTMFVDGLPTTDNAIGFEDLVMFAINFHPVVPPYLKTAPANTDAERSANDLLLEAPDQAEAGATLTARLLLRGSGNLVALSTTLTWDPAVVEPIGHVAGNWLTAQNGVAFSAAPGTVDAAVFQAQGMSGEGELATVTFRVLSSGDPKIRVASTDGRDARNQAVVVASSLQPRVAVVPTVTQLAPSKPNPFRQAATVAFSLATGGPVELVLYSVSGRAVRTLATGVHAAGEYTMVWDGRGDDGITVSPGVYYLRLTTGQGRFTRTMTYLR